MKNLISLTLLIFCYINFVSFSQEIKKQRDYPDIPEFFIPRNHDANYRFNKQMPPRSFYERKYEWQHIIDSTWGPGDTLTRKLQIFNTYAQKVHDHFDGFLSLQLNWDSLYLYYLDQINDSTSKGVFSSIMSHFSYSLKDLHTRAVDTTVVLTPLNPGVPILLLGSYLTVEHFGAVTTVLPDSTTLILRIVPNHPLNLEPGDIILGYEGVPWKDLVQELFDAGLPMFAKTGGCESANTYLSLFGAGINWHLFNTIDILKYSTRDTIHLSVLPLLNLNVPPMANNEQLSIPNIPFPNIIEEQNVTYGTLENTNVGYIYLAGEWPEAAADAQFYEAVNALKNTDALIIDMRLNYGGWALFDNAFRILFNESQNTLEEAYRCYSNTFDLCPSSWWQEYRIDGMAPEYYDRPIAVLLGPTCVSMGDITAQRLRYHPMIRFFGTSPDASLGYNEYIESFPGWYLRYSTGDMFHLSKPDEYLNRSEFPIDYPIWQNADDVAIGRDAVVEKALDWINNLVYGHSLTKNINYYRPPIDTLKISALLENPNSHQTSSKVYIQNLDETFVDSLELEKIGVSDELETWEGKYLTTIPEDIYNISLSSTDIDESKTWTTDNIDRFTTAGPIIVDSIEFTLYTNFRYLIKPVIKNESITHTLNNLRVVLYCYDPWVTSIGGAYRTISVISPGEIVPVSQPFAVTSDSASFPGYFNLKFEISMDLWPYWTDSVKLATSPVGIDDKLMQQLTFKLEQNYPNPFNPTTKISWQSPMGSWQTLKVYDILGREVATLVDEFRPAGKYEVEWDAQLLSSGIYFYKITTENFSQTKKMIYLK